MIWGFVLIFCAVYAKASSVCPHIVSRDEWGGKPADQVEYSIIPVPYVIIQHTVTPTCSSVATCSNLIANMQHFHMNELGFHDIGYNFLIDSEGNIYKGLGWHLVGAHTRGYNSKSIGVAFIGNFMEMSPTQKSINAAKKLLSCGVHEGELDPRYKLLGARQVSSTQSPGIKLFKEIKTWPNFANKP